jgi:hypothetical protein
MLDPAVEERSGSDALMLTGGLQQFLVIIDDITRGGTPAETLKKIISWRRPAKSDGDENSYSTSHSIVVPVWDLFWAPLKDQFRSSTWLESLSISRMDDEEACSCLTAALGQRAKLLCTVDMENVVKGLAYDPILIALYSDTYEDGNQIAKPTLAIEVIERFSNSCAKETAASSMYSSSEFESALVKLAFWMLKERDLYPRWEKILECWPENDINPLRELVHRGKICQISGRAETSRFEFRHDRILEHFLSSALSRMFGSLDEYHEIITDPYYANYVGRALATSYVDDELILWMEVEAPLALLAAVQFLPEKFSESPSALIAAATITAARRTPYASKHLKFLRRPIRRMSWISLNQ